MATQGKCTDCKVHYVFTDDVTGFNCDVRFTLPEILCPKWLKPLQRTSGLQRKFVRQLIRESQLKTALYDNKKELDNN